MTGLIGLSSRYVVWDRFESHEYCNGVYLCIWHSGHERYIGQNDVPKLGSLGKVYYELRLLTSQRLAGGNVWQYVFPYIVDIEG